MDFGLSMGSCKMFESSVLCVLLPRGSSLLMLLAMANSILSMAWNPPWQLVANATLRIFAHGVQLVGSTCLYLWFTNDLLDLLWENCMFQASRTLPASSDMVSSEMVLEHPSRRTWRQNMTYTYTYIWSICIKVLVNSLIRLSRVQAWWGMVPNVTWCLHGWSITGAGRSRATVNASLASLTNHLNPVDGCQPANLWGCSNHHHHWQLRRWWFDLQLSKLQFTGHDPILQSI
jgi:hypothetical protein